MPDRHKRPGICSSDSGAFRTFCALLIAGLGEFLCSLPSRAAESDQTQLVMLTNLYLTRINAPGKLSACLLPLDFGTGRSEAGS